MSFSRPAVRGSSRLRAGKWSRLAVALGAVYDHGGLFLLTEAGALSARRLSCSISSSRGLTAAFARGTGAFRLPLWSKAELEPHVATGPVEAEETQ